MSPGLFPATFVNRDEAHSGSSRFPRRLLSLSAGPAALDGSLGTGTARPSKRTDGRALAQLRLVLAHRPAFSRADLAPGQRRLRGDRWDLGTQRTPPPSCPRRPRPSSPAKDAQRFVQQT